VKENSLAPVALFVYNRPEHTRRTLESLRRNEGSDRSRLVIFSDGPREDASEDERHKIENVRHLIRENRWCAHCEIVESHKNMGLARSITSGVDSVLEMSKRIIVLEDDLELSPGFLRYMNRALDLYEDESRVYQVTGYMVPNKRSAPSTGFLRIISSWGWGTWKRAWRHYDSDVAGLLEKVRNKGRAEFDLGGVAHQFHDLERNARGDLNTWAVRWYASVFLNDGLCLYPRNTLVKNIGIDGSGVNFRSLDAYGKWHARLVNDIEVGQREIMEDPIYLASMQAHYRRLQEHWGNSRRASRLLKQVRARFGRLTSSS